MQVMVDYIACYYIRFQGDIPLRSSGSEIETLNMVTATTINLEVSCMIKEMLVWLVEDV